MTINCDHCGKILGTVSIDGTVTINHGGRRIVADCRLLEQVCDRCHKVTRVSLPPYNAPRLDDMTKVLK